MPAPARREASTTSRLTLRRSSVPRVEDQQAQQRPTEQVERRATGAIGEQQPALEDAAPGMLLGTGHLADADALLDELAHQLGDGARAERAAEVAGVLVEQAMRDERDAAAALVPQPTGQQQITRAGHGGLGGRVPLAAGLITRPGNRLAVRVSWRVAGATAMARRRCRWSARQSRGQLDAKSGDAGVGDRLDRQT